MPPPEEVSSPKPNERAGGGGEAPDGGTPPAPVDGSAAATDKWFIEMRGWIKVLAMQVASFTYQAGINPPDRFSSIDNGNDDSHDVFRFMVFFYSNTTAFLTSLGIIILLMNRSFYGSLVRVTVLEIIVVLDMMGLMAAYWAGSTQKFQTNMFALLLTALVLFVIYVVYAARLVWGLFAAAVWRRRRVVPVPARAATGQDGGGGTPPVTNLQEKDIDDTRAAPPPLDVDRLKSELRRRDSRLVLARSPGTGQSTMLSP